MTFMPDDYGGLAGALAGYGRKTNPYDARRKYDYSLLQQGTDTSPVQSPWQGAARLAQALAGGIGLAMTDTEEKAADKKRSDALAQAMSEPDPQKRIGLLAAYDPDQGARAAGQLAVEQAKLSQQQGMLRDGAKNFGGSFPQGANGGPTQLGPNATAISGIESAGQPNNGYGAIGPPADAKGSRAIGKFQVMDYNVGPWTQEILGKAMSPQEFLANPDAQNKVFEAKFGQYVTQFGSPQAASRAWFAGPGGMNNPNARDVNGMTPGRYEQKFSQNLPPEAQNAPPVGAQPGLVIDMTKPNVAPQPSQMPPQGGAAPPMAGGQGADGMPPPATAQNVSGPAVVAPPAPPAVPDVPRPQPTPQMLQQYQQRIATGEFGINPQEAFSRARAAMDAELDRQWTVDRERRFKEFDVQANDYRANRDDAMKQPQQTLGNESKLRDDFRSEPAVKAYREVVPIMESAKEAVSRPNRAADLNLVYALAKMMDPNSVVREGEMVMVQKTGTVADTLGSLIGSLNGGQMMTNETRQKVVQEMQSRYKGLEESHNTIADVYKGIAQRGGMNPENVVIGVRKPKPAEGGAAAQQEITIGLDGKPR